MTDTLEKRIQWLQQQADRPFGGMLTGVEKESLRVTADGRLSQRPHPEELGSALSNQFITTDFSEALLEFVTPAFDTPSETRACLQDIHQFAQPRMGDEVLWNASMPCRLGAESEIPIAEYGSSNVARMKTIYRRGLSHRYGRAMQTIAGVHFNFSVPVEFWNYCSPMLGVSDSADDLRSQGYLALARNFRRMAWLVLYLFGASPAMCRSFLGDRATSLAEFDSNTLFEPYATSLRMSDLGYNNSAQAGLAVSLNSLTDYIDQLTSAIMTPHPPYESIGIEVGGQWRQLNANLLQIENEYYSSVRPKQVAHSGERPTLALQRDGVAYVEIRALDINPFDPVGVTEAQMLFMQTLLVTCLLRPSRLLDHDQLQEAAANQLLVAHSGRAPALELHRFGQRIGLREWALELFDEFDAVAQLMDGDGRDYRNAVDQQRDVLMEVSETPSARVLREMREQNANFVDYTLEQSRAHATSFERRPPIPDDRLQALRREVTESMQRQNELESRPQQRFADYLADYFRVG
ncbi:MAG: glutamate--cysteine ligase [Pseudomonadota bacterium]